MTDLASLPASVLLKIAQMEGDCIGLVTKLEASRRELQRLRIELRDLAPRTVHDEYSANRESERLIAENMRLETAISAQIATCERQEKRLRREEATVRSCKQFLHDLPANARLRVVEGCAGDLAAIRERIKATQDEIARVERLPVPSDDIGDRIRRYVDELAAKARPVITGVGDGQALRVLYPLTESASRITLTGFSDFEANPLLLLALVAGERLAERLTQAALEGSVPASERTARLHDLQEQLTGLRYDEEAAVCAALERGEDVSRSGPAWAVLMVQVEHELEAAA